jgi:hypothetical protein
VACSFLHLLFLPRISWHELARVSLYRAQVALSKREGENGGRSGGLWMRPQARPQARGRL